MISGKACGWFWYTLSQFFDNYHRTFLYIYILQYSILHHCTNLKLQTNQKTLFFFIIQTDILSVSKKIEKSEIFEKSRKKTTKNNEKCGHWTDGQHGEKCKGNNFFYFSTVSMRKKGHFREFEKVSFLWEFFRLKVYVFGTKFVIFFDILSGTICPRQCPVFYFFYPIG